MSGTLATEDPDREADAFDRLQHWIDEFDRSCNRFQDDSEISTLNAEGTLSGMSSTFERALDAARRSYDMTGGLCDPTVLEALEALGYDRDYSSVLAAAPRADRVIGPSPGWDAVHVDLDARTVSLDSGARLDLGASAKALLADILVEELASFGGALCEVGGDVALHGHGPDGPWVVGLATTLSITGLEPRVSLERGGLATSSTTTRVWESHERVVNHIVDPRTGDCASGPYVVATVAADSCVNANAYATAALLWGDEAPRRIAAGGHSARLVRHDGTLEFVGGWPSEVSGS